MLLDTLLAAVICKATNPGAPFIYLFFGAEWFYTPQWRLEGLLYKRVTH